MERSRGRGGRRAGLRSGLAAAVAACLLAACTGPNVTVASSSLAAVADDPAAGVEVFADPEVADAVITGSVGVEGVDDDEAAVADALWRTLVEVDEPWPVVDALASAADERGEVDATYRDAIAAGLGARAAEIDDRREQDEWGDGTWPAVMAMLVSLIDGGGGAGVALTDGGIDTLLVRIAPAVVRDYFDEGHGGVGTEAAFGSEGTDRWSSALQFARTEAEVDQPTRRRWLLAAAGLGPQGQREPVPPARFAELDDAAAAGGDDEGPTLAEITAVLETRVAAHLFDAVPELRDPGSPVPDAVGTADVDAFAAVDEIERLVTVVAELIARRLDE